MSRLYHFTCRDGYKRIGRYNCVLIPQRGLWPFIWLTSEAEPDFQASGLHPYGRSTLKCDRTEYRYIITDTSMCRPWLGSADRLAVDPEFVTVLESYGDPEHWWIASEPVRAEWDRAYRAAIEATRLPLQRFFLTLANGLG